MVLRAGMLWRSQKKGLACDRKRFTAPFLMAWLERQTMCECCNRLLDIGFKQDNQKHDDSPSIDRIIPEKGYVKGNVALLCWRCNNLKRDATISELETIVAWMRTKYGNEVV